MKRISAASFVVEPGDLWQRRIARRFFDRAPRMASHAGEDAFVFPGESQRTVPSRSVRWRDDRLTTADGWTRAMLLAEASVEAEVIFPSYAWSLLALRDEAFRAACFRAYNNWMFDFCIASSKRFHSAILIPGAESGCAEIERGAKRRAKAAIIGVDDDDRAAVDSVLRCAAAQKMAVVLAKRGGATPVDDLAAFSRQSAALVGRYAASGTRFVLLGGSPSAPTAGVLPVMTNSSVAGAAWAILGDSANLKNAGPSAFARDNAAAFYGL